MSPFAIGFVTAFGLILAIGAQNAFVLRQGIKGEYVGPIVLFCAISDALLIFLGVYGAGAVIEKYPQIAMIFKWLGIGFLLFYGFSRLVSAYKGEVLQASQEKVNSLKAALLTCAAFTYLNPHVYLDTWVLMGALSQNYFGSAKLSFALGACTSSFVFFTALGYGAKLLRPLFQSQTAWRVLDLGIAILMFALAFGLWRGEI